MPIDFNKKYVYIHIPKTGGSSIQSALSINKKENYSLSEWDLYNFDGISFSPHHLTLSYLRKLDPSISDFKSFVTVRNPYDKAVSEYYYLSRTLYQNPLSKFEIYKFNQWLDEHYFTFKRDHYLPQNRFIDETIGMVVKIENLKEKWNNIIDYLDIEFRPLPHENSNIVTNTKEISKLLDNDTKMKIYRTLRDDFDKFEYNK